MFEPRGHDMMSGSILYPPTRADCDVGILFIETSGCLPMCGHGTIGTVTMAIEHGLVTPKHDGRAEARHAGRPVVARYEQQGRFVESVRILNVAVLSACRATSRSIARARRARVRHRLWRQLLRHRRAAEELSRTWPTSRPATSLRLSPVAAPAAERQDRGRCIRRTRRSAASATSCGPASRAIPKAHARNAVFYGDKAIDRCPAAPAPRRAWRSSPPRASSSPATTSSTRASSAACSTAGSRPRPGRQPRRHHPLDRRLGADHGINTIFVDDRDPYAHGSRCLSRPPVRAGAGSGEVGAFDARTPPRTSRRPRPRFSQLVQVAVLASLHVLLASCSDAGGRPGMFATGMRPKPSCSIQSTAPDSLTCGRRQSWNLFTRCRHLLWLQDRDPFLLVFVRHRLRHASMVLTAS